MTISVLTVTYSDRSDYLIQVLEALAIQGISRVCIVFNGCEYNVVSKIENRAIELGLELESIVHKENEGSAGGFYKGLKVLKEKKLIDDRLLILDDDNLVPDGLINDLLNKEIDRYNIAFVLREDRANLLDARHYQNPFINISTRNSFLGRDIFKASSAAYEQVDSEIVCVPYSGMFLHKDTLDLDILPNPEYYLYSDDYDFSYRLVVDKKCKIHIYSDKKIKDLEQSFHLKKNKTFLSNRYISASSFQIYYSVRNQIIFSSLRIDNKVKFKVNAFIVTLYLIMSFLFHRKVKNIKVLGKAIVDGFRRKTGRSYL